jgi:hypothetical protein
MMPTMKKSGESFRLRLDRRQTLRGLTKHLGAENLEAVENCADRLFDSLPDKTDLARNVVLVTYGGGKDSSFVLSAVRQFQLMIEREMGETFLLRVATNVQPGMAWGVFDNIKRVYDVLRLTRDPSVELLVVEGNRVVPYSPSYRMPADLVADTRTDILMNGHLSRGSNRATFCNGCNFSMSRSFHLALSHGQGADLIVTGDSTHERRKYALAIARMARELGINEGGDASHRGFGQFMDRLDAVADVYNRHVYGDGAPEVADRRVKVGPTLKDPTFFSIFEDLSYDAGSHWGLLTEFLKFEFHHLAFSFTESDCINPALMAHLRGLRSQHMWGRKYDDGVGEYAREFAIPLMRKKQFPEPLVATMERRYADEAAVDVVRGHVRRYAEEVLGLGDDQLVCMLYSPFTAGAIHLDAYLDRERPEARGWAESIRGLLGSDAAPATGQLAMAGAIEVWSGLSLEKLRRLYRSALADNTTIDPRGSTTNPIEILFRLDPHQGPVTTRHAPDGAELHEIESGR